MSDTVRRKALRESGDEPDALLRGYRAAFWTCCGFGLVGTWEAWPRANVHFLMIVPNFEQPWPLPWSSSVVSASLDMFQKRKKKRSRSVLRSHLRFRTWVIIGFYEVFVDRPADLMLGNMCFANLIRKQTHLITECNLRVREPRRVERQPPPQSS